MPIQASTLPVEHQPQHRSPSRASIVLLAIAAGLAVANVTFAQPLLSAIAETFGISRDVAGSITSISQLGYAAGLILVVPLGDILNRKALIAGLLLAASVGLFVIATAHRTELLLTGFAAVGVAGVLAQVAVAHAAIEALPEDRGRIVGSVTRGIIVGILSARVIAGALSDAFGWQAVFLTASLIAVAAAGAVLLWLPPQIHSFNRVSYSYLLRSLGALFREEAPLRRRSALAFLMFASVTVIWTSIALELSSSHYSLSYMQIGMFGLAGLGGAAIAPRVGALADRGYAEAATGWALALMLLAWAPASLLSMSLAALAVALVMIDIGLQSAHIVNQTVIYQTRPEARSRLAAGYMVFYSMGSATGAILASLAHAAGGWIAACSLGAAINVVALATWLCTRDN